MILATVEPHGDPLTSKTDDTNHSRPLSQGIWNESGTTLFESPGSLWKTAGLKMLLHFKLVLKEKSKLRREALLAWGAGKTSTVPSLPTAQTTERGPSHMLRSSLALANVIPDFPEEQMEIQILTAKERTALMRWHSLLVPETHRNHKAELRGLAPEKRVISPAVWDRLTRREGMRFIFNPLGVAVSGTGRAFSSFKDKKHKRTWEETPCSFAIFPPHCTFSSNTEPQRQSWKTFVKPQWRIRALSVTSLTGKS